MTTIPIDLLKDPLFQLNTLLWLAQPLPDRSDIIPLFYKQRFTVYAIAPLLGMPLDLRLVAQRTQIRMQDRVRPDVVLTQESNQKFAFTECKASAFSPASSTADQARSLLIVAGPRSSEILGLAPGQVSDSLLVFLVPESDRNPLVQTLVNLQKELKDSELLTGQFSVLGLLLTDTDISVVIDNLGGKFFVLPSSTNPFMKRDPDTDPRMLYFIPYDPDIEQSNQERIFCKRVLFERMHSTVISAVGRSNPPINLTLESQKILNDAMFGMYGHWENRNSAQHMRRICRQFMDVLMKVVNSEIPDTMAFQAGQGWKISLLDKKQHEKVIDALTRFSCERLDLQDEPQPGLFDELENS